MMFNTAVISKGKFRVLVLGIFLSIIYDLLWFYLKHSEYAQGEQSNDGSAELGLRKFSLVMSYSSFFLKVLLIWF